MALVLACLVLETVHSLDQLQGFSLEVQEVSSLLLGKYGGNLEKLLKISQDHPAMHFLHPV